MSIAEEKAKTESESSEDLQLQTIPEVRERIANLVKSNAINMVQKTIDQVKAGHYAAMKYLFEMIGLFPASHHEKSPEEDSLAQTLLRGLGLADELTPDANIKSNHKLDSTAHTSDTVE